MIPHVKICGITNLEDALFCAHAGADSLGFIFYKKSPRFIEPAEAARIIGELPAYITPVGVFVNEHRSGIERAVRETGIRIIQLSGNEFPDQCQGYAVKVWKAFRIRDLDAVETVKPYTISAALLDGATGDTFGGSGTLPDFSIACEVKEYHPIILAGGLNPENILGAIQAVEPFGVDVCSGVESLPGKKNHDQVKLLFERLQRLRNQ